MSNAHVPLHIIGYLLKMTDRFYSVWFLICLAVFEPRFFVSARLGYTILGPVENIQFATKSLACIACYDSAGYMSSAAPKRHYVVQKSFVDCA